MEMSTNTALTMWVIIVVLLFVGTAVDGIKYCGLFKYFAGLFVLASISVSALYSILVIWS